jgi:hypothetical protein
MSLRFSPITVAVATSLLLAACGGGNPLVEELAQPQAEDEQLVKAMSVNLASLPAAPAGLRGNVVCRNWRIGAVTLDNVEVAPGASCQLNGTVIRGSLQAQAAATIDANRVQVAGSVQSEQGASVTVRNASRVSGDIEIEGGGAVVVRGSTVAGNVMVNGISGAFIARNNTVGGGVQLTDNLGGGEVIGNRINGALQCTGNLPLPTASGNTAASLEGDCAPGASGGGGVTPPLSGNVTCVGLTIGAVQLDSVIVPAGASCTLVGTRLNGNLEVGANSRLSADSVAVTGGLVSDGAASLTISGASSFGGSVQVQRGLEARLMGLAATGDLQIDNMFGPVVASNNRISGNAQVMTNRGGVTLSTNRFGGVMQCKDNLPAPTGGGNVATLKEDQCRLL